MKKDGIDWYRFIIHFFCGAVLGAICGFGAGAYCYESDRALCYSGIVGATVTGLLAGIYGDRFWLWIIEPHRRE